MSALGSAMAASRTSHRLGRKLADTLGVRWGCPISSGRAALALLFDVLHRREPEREEVVVPAFTCFSVPSAIARAGLRVRLVDLGPRTFDMDASQLAAVVGPRTLAIVATHLLGFPGELRPLRAAARAHGATLIDDAAQALGARYEGRPVGAGSTLGILSFGRGKPLGALGGGAIVCDDQQLVADIDRAMAALPRTSLQTAAANALVASIYTPLLRPEIYWVPAHLPFLKLGVCEYDPDFPMQRLDGFRIGLVLRGLSRLEEVNEARRRAAERLTGALSGISGLTLLPPPPNSETIYLRFPILMPSAELRDQALKALRLAGIGASRLYPEPLTAIPALILLSPDAKQRFPRATRLAEELLCLPTYPHVGDEAVARAAEILAAVMAQGGGRAPRAASA
jgi:dTDP-4-amino-4,6-dideoxygalactose transaminase